MSRPIDGDGTIEVLDRQAGRENAPAVAETTGEADHAR